MNLFLNHPRLLLVQKVEKADFHGKSAVRAGAGMCVGPLLKTLSGQAPLAASAADSCLDRSR